MKCLVAGATGLVGENLLKELLVDPKVGAVTAVLRKPLDIADPKLRMRVVSFDGLSAAELPAADVAFCALGTTIKKAGSQEAFSRVDHDYTLSFARAALNAGVKTFVLCSAMGADADSRIFYNRVKGKTERDLAALHFHRFVIVRPSLLLGERRENRPAERFAQAIGQALRPLMQGPLAKLKPVTGVEVARTMKNAGLDDRSSGVIFNDAIG